MKALESILPRDRSVGIAQLGSSFAPSQRSNQLPVPLELSIGNSMILSSTLVNAPI